MSPESSPTPPPITTRRAEAYMDYENHMLSRRDIIETHHELTASVEPAAHTISVQGVRLKGKVPLSLQSKIDSRYKYLAYNSQRKALGEPASASIYLQGESTADQLEIRSDDVEVEFAHNKQFLLHPFGKPDATVPIWIGFDDLCLLLDDLIPDPRFLRLSDPHNDMSFNVATLRMADIFKQLGSRYNDVRGYKTTLNTMSSIETNMEELEASAQLIVSESQESRKVPLKRSFGLEFNSPVVTPFGNLIEKFRYSFAQNISQKHDARDQDPIASNSYVLIESGIQNTEYLNILLKGAQEDINGRNLVERALHMLLTYSQHRHF